jgi:hypothetical protein
MAASSSTRLWLAHQEGGKAGRFLGWVDAQPRSEPVSFPLFLRQTFLVRVFPNKKCVLVLPSRPSRLPAFLFARAPWMTLQQGMR